MTLRPGVHNVMATPFLRDESLDVESIHSLVGYCADAGCDGVLILGVLGEADRLSDAERQTVIRATVDTARGMQVTVGITHQSTVVTRARALEAVEAGATAVMVSPPVGSAAGPALHDHFARIAENLPIPVVVQDHPASSGVNMPVDFIVGLAGVLPPGGVVKLEAPPTGPKTATLLSKTDAYTVLGGLGGVSLMQELEAGSIGTMTGFALPDVLVRIVSAYRAGDVEAAFRAFEEALPVIVFEAQPGAGVGLRKEILRRRGAIAHATVRQPAPVADPTLLASLETLLERLEMRTAVS